MGAGSALAHAAPSVIMALGAVIAVIFSAQSLVFTFMSVTPAGYRAMLKSSLVGTLIATVLSSFLSLAVAGTIASVGLILALGTSVHVFFLRGEPKQVINPLLEALDRPSNAIWSETVDPYLDLDRALEAVGVEPGPKSVQPRSVQPVLAHMDILGSAAARNFLRDRELRAAYRGGKVELLDEFDIVLTRMSLTDFARNIGDSK